MPDMAARVAHVCLKSYSLNEVTPLRLSAPECALLTFSMGRFASFSCGNRYRPAALATRRFATSSAAKLRLILRLAALLLPKGLKTRRSDR